MGLSENQIREQSLAAYNQWKDQWRDHAKIHSNLPEIKNSFKDFENIGVGRAVVCVGNGASLEDGIDDLRKHQDNVDIVCCDKSLGVLLEHGITPTYCVVCDANVSWEKYGKKWQDKLSETILISNVCASTEWSHKAKWKNIFFFVNMDVLKSEVEFSELSGCNNVVPAATNVSNAMVVLLTQSDNKGAKNHFGYDKILLIGYDYCWLRGGNYYALDKDGGGKQNYMRHITGWTQGGDICYTSNNLHFSCLWLNDYVHTFGLPVVQCTKKTMSGIRYASMESQIAYRYKAEDSGVVKTLSEEIKAMKKSLDKKLSVIKGIKNDHHTRFLTTT